MMSDQDAGPSSWMMRSSAAMMLAITFAACGATLGIPDGGIAVGEATDNDPPRPDEFAIGDGGQGITPNGGSDSDPGGTTRDAGVRDGGTTGADPIGRDGGSTFGPNYSASNDFSAGIDPFRICDGCSGMGCPRVQSGTLVFRADWNMICAPSDHPSDAAVFSYSFDVVRPGDMNVMFGIQSHGVANFRYAPKDGATYCGNGSQPVAARVSPFESGDRWTVSYDKRSGAISYLRNGVLFLTTTCASVKTTSGELYFGWSSGPYGPINVAIDNLTFTAAR